MDCDTHEANHFDTSLLEFTLHLGKGTELGRADGGEVGRVGEEDGPGVAEELVEVDLAMSGQGLEVGRCSHTVNFESRYRQEDGTSNAYRWNPGADEAVPAWPGTGA